MRKQKIAAKSLAPFRKRLLAWYARNKRAMPWRGTRDAYRVWVSEIMLQQTRVAAVLPYYLRFMRRFPTVRALARARGEVVLRHWAGLGYYSRARNLHRAAKEIIARHSGKFPRSYDAALALPGVGRYTAAAVLSIAYGQPLAVVDGNVARVIARLTAMRGDMRANGRWRQIEETALGLMGESDQKQRRRQDAGGTRAGDWNQAMMELGATVCTPRAPRCRECPVARWCRAYELGIAERIPSARQKRETEKLVIAAAVLLDPRGRTLLVKPDKAETNGLFSHMWQFPAAALNGVKRDAQVQNLFATQMNTDKHRWGKSRGKESTQRTRTNAEGAEKNGEGLFAALRMTRALRGTAKEWVALAAVRHTVTFREITLRPFLMRVRELPATNGARVVALSDVARMAVSSATKKIVRTVEKNVAAATP